MWMSWFFFPPATAWNFCLPAALLPRASGDKVGAEAHVGLPGSVPLDSYLYVHEDLEAVKHLFMVASSLDSMIVGEPQILGQLKKAYREAVECRTVKVVLNRLLHKSFSVAKTRAN